MVTTKAKLRSKKIVKPAKKTIKPVQSGNKTVTVTILHEVKAHSNDHARTVKGQILKSVKHAKFSKTTQLKNGFVKFLVETVYKQNIPRSVSNSVFRAYILKNSPGAKSIKVE